MFEISEHKRNLFVGHLRGHDVQVHGLSWERINTHGSYFNIFLTSWLRIELNLLLKDRTGAMLFEKSNAFWKGNVRG